ncbi:hypothetical protein ASA1KI_04720 [Opitutales bacterium ASA1]|jgi:hypothetical protein|uniref:hypothetical protein n=1 Tax=Congregicoccus parvus TaxID=3081749 RepID=UPI002B2AA7CD|nr:hypothetical protein ASA1KI_04720 [Opitutales bacterium ASA1]
MEWILDNLQLVIAAIIIVGYILRGLKRGNPEEEAVEQDESTAPHEQADADERTRRIQEEIRRRILERQRGPAEGAPPPLILFEPEPEEAPPVRPVYSTPAPPPIPRMEEQESAMAAVLERQRSLDDQLRAIRAARAAAREQSAFALPGTRSRDPIKDGAIGSLRESLTGPAAMRRAIVLREVLGEPVGLRQGSNEWPRR